MYHRKSIWKRLCLIQLINSVNCNIKVSCSLTNPLLLDKTKQLQKVRIQHVNLKFRNISMYSLNLWASLVPFIFDFAAVYRWHTDFRRKPTSNNMSHKLQVWHMDVKHTQPTYHSISVTLLCLLLSHHPIRPNSLIKRWQVTTMYSSNGCWFGN